MKLLNKSLWLVVAVLTTTITFTACSKNNPNNQDKSLKIISANSNEPQSPLIPADTNETGGWKVISSIFSGLTYYDKDGNTQFDLAKSIETKDKQHYTVTLVDDAKFSDGSEVKAEHFVKAWNLAVEKRFKLSSFFNEIQGFPDNPKDKVTQLSGLKVINDKTFTITLKYPVGDFIMKLGYGAFFPMSDKAFTDLQAYGQHPIGNGPYQLEKASDWQHNESIIIKVNPYYNGPRKAQNDGLLFKFYAKLSAAYADALSGQLDISSVPDEHLANFTKDFPNNHISKPSASASAIAININTPHFKMDEEGKLRRKALSLALNRQQLADIIFQGIVTPATDFTSPVVVGYNPSLPGNEVLSYNPKLAKELWDKANAISKFNDTLTIAYNADGGNDSWVEAVTNQWKNVLGIKAEGNPIPDFKTFLDLAKKREFKSAFRSGWIADYPSAFNFLEPIFTTAAKVGSNFSDYSNNDFEQYLKAASTSTNDKEWQNNINKAQELLLRDLPAIPLFNGKAVSVYNKKLSNVIPGWDGVQYYSIIKN